ncbi:hypothetical protein Pfo_003445, partial [Paulownia fortunei]
MDIDNRQTGNHGVCPWASTLQKRAHTHTELISSTLAVLSLASRAVSLFFPSKLKKSWGVYREGQPPFWNSHISLCNPHSSSSELMILVLELVGFTNVVVVLDFCFLICPSFDRGFMGCCTKLK